MRLRWGSNLLLLAAGLLLGTNLVFLWEIRGYDVTGWELIGPAEAVLNYVRGGVVYALRVHLDHSRHYQFYSGMSSVFFSVVPGWLHLHVVWLLWAPLVALALTIVFFAIFLASLQLDAAVFMLGWAASGALMTLSIMGVPHVAATFPFCVGVPAVLLRANTRATFFALGLDAIIWAAIWELTLHCYEPGRSVAVVPLLAAVTLPAVPVRRRAVWILCTVAMLWAYARFVSLSLDYGVLIADLPATIRQLPTAARLVWEALFRQWRLDYPFTLVLAVFGLVVMRTHKLFWVAVLCLALTLVFLLAVVGLLQHLPGGIDILRARRFGVVAFLAAAVVARAWNDGDRFHFRRIACAGLLAASVFALYQTYRFGTGRASWKSLPFTESIADLHVDRKLDIDAARLAAYASGSAEQHLILYGYSTYAENSTDPKCFPERVLLQMEPEKFLERIRFIDGELPLRSRYSRVPMYATSVLLKTVEEIKPFYLHVHREPINNDVRYLRVDGSIYRASWLAEVLRNADVEWVDLGLHKFTSFHVQPRAKAVQAAGMLAR